MTNNIYNEEELLIEDDNILIIEKSPNDFVEYSKDFEHFVNITQKKCSLQSGHFNTAIHILSFVLFKMYGTTDINQLYEDSKKYGSIEKFAKTLNEVLDEQDFKPNSKRIILYSIKKILKESSICVSFIDQLQSNTSKPTLHENDIRNYLPEKYKKMSTNSPSLKVVINWTMKIKRKSKIKSFATLRQVMYFVLKVLENLNIEPVENLELDLELVKQFVKNNRHNYYIKTFYKCVLEKEIELNLDFQKSDKFINCDGGDIHKFTAEELQKIYDMSKENLRNELIIMLLCTTGMRVGGLTNIKIDNIATKIDGKLIIKDIGRTLEKNNKWFSFNITNHVKEMLWEWIVNKRPYSLDNQYLFTGRKGGSLSTNRVRNIIKEIAKKCGIEGVHVHPHSFRHTYAHMLLECGNSIENISKLLGHASSATTESYYLKESAVEVSKRSNIPWLDNKPQERIVPEFLATNNKTNQDLQKEKDSKTKKRARRKNLALLSKEFKAISTLETINEN